MLTIHIWPKRLKEFLLTHSLYKSPFLIFDIMASGNEERRHDMKKEKTPSLRQALVCCLSVTMAASAAVAATDYQTFLKMVGHDGKESASHVEDMSRDGDFFRADGLYTVRVYAPERNRVALCSDTFGGDHGFAPHAEARERSEMDAALGGKDARAEPWRRTCFVTLEEKDGKLRVKYVMPADRYIRHYSDWCRTKLNARRRDLPEGLKGAWAGIVKSYLELLDIASDEECVRLSLASRLGVEAVKQTEPEKFGELLGKIEEFKGRCQAMSASVREIRDTSEKLDASLRRARAEAGTGSSYRMPTAEFLEKMDEIDRKGWDARKKRKAYGNLIDKYLGR